MTSSVTCSLSTCDVDMKLLILIGELDAKNPYLSSVHFPRCKDFAIYLARAGIATGQRPAPRAQQVGAGRRLRRHPETALDVTAIVAALAASSAMNTNADGASSVRSSGSLSRNHAARRDRLRPPCTAIAIFASGCEMPCKVEMGRPMCNGSWRTRPRSSSSPRPNPPAPPPSATATHQARVGISPRRRAAAQHRTAIRSRWVDPGHRQPADVVDLAPAGRQR